MNQGLYKIIEWLSDNFFSITTFIVSAIALWISIRAWYKSRVFYGIEVFELHHSDHFGLLNKELQKKLSTGKYTILNTYQDKDVFLSVNLERREKVFILLGKIKN